MKSVRFNEPTSVMEFLERHCGLDIANVEITYSFNYIKIECDGDLILEAKGETEQKTWYEAHKRLDTYYQEVAIMQFLPDVIQDLRLSQSKGELCQGTLKCLKTITSLLVDINQ